MMKKTAGSGNAPELLHQISFSFVPSRVLAAAVQLDVFSHIAAGKKTADAIARAAKANQRGMRMLLDALTGLELLAKRNNEYSLAPIAARFLVRKSPDYMGAILEQDGLYEGWMHLADVIRTGKPVRRVEEEEKATQFFPILVSTLHILNRDPARRTAQVLGAGSARKPLSVVDVACGSGVWGIAMAEAFPQARITAQDFGAMLDQTRKYVQRHGLEDRFDYLPGDLKQVDFGKERFDVALLGNIVHSEGERSSRNLLRKLYRALRPGGKLAIIDMIPNDKRTGPPFPLFFALNILVNTEAGDTYTLAEYKQWLNDAGFSRVKTADIGSHSPLIVGIKA